MVRLVTFSDSLSVRLRRIAKSAWLSSLQSDILPRQWWIGLVPRGRPGCYRPPVFNWMVESPARIVGSCPPTDRGNRSMARKAFAPTPRLERRRQKHKKHHKRPYIVFFVFTR